MGGEGGLTAVIRSSASFLLSSAAAALFCHLTLFSITIVSVGTQVADFGMTAGNDGDEAASDNATPSSKTAAWIGTYLYMAPVRLVRPRA